MDAPCEALVDHLLGLADDRLVLGHRLSEWCGHAPILEEDIALANVALDSIGQASLLLERAGELEGRGRTADDLAFFRDVTDFRNCLLVEQPNGDFAATIVRQFLFDAWSVPLTGALRRSADAGLAAWAEKAAKECAYHLRHSRSWIVRLGDGTEESRERTARAVRELWIFTGELFDPSTVDERIVREGIAIDPASLEAPWRAEVEATFREATLDVPDAAPGRRGGRAGSHGEALGHLLDEMQVLARSHPGAEW